jgi:hypothetical protein
VSPHETVGHYCPRASGRLPSPVRAAAAGLAMAAQAMAGGYAANDEPFRRTTTMPLRAPDGSTFSDLPR